MGILSKLFIEGNYDVSRAKNNIVCSDRYYPAMEGVLKLHDIITMVARGIGTFPVHDHPLSTNDKFHPTCSVKPNASDLTWHEQRLVKYQIVCTLVRNL